MTLFVRCFDYSLELFQQWDIFSFFSLYFSTYIEKCRISNAAHFLRLSCVASIISQSSTSSGYSLEEVKITISVSSFTLECIGNFITIGCFGCWWLLIDRSRTFVNNTASLFDSSSATFTSFVWTIWNRIMFNGNELSLFRGEITVTFARYKIDRTPDSLSLAVKSRCAGYP